tara:strand:- start:66 stop:848 length:783 start_codon:yes stop_codon:yes gene_type:complete
VSDVILVEHAKTDAGAVISTVTVNRPDKLNALNRAVLEGMEQALGEVRDAGARCMILTGAGKAFVAGADIAAMQSMSPDEARGFAELGHRVGHAMEAQPYPIIAAINGFALGGGCELAMACDFAFASTKAKLGQPETKLGVIPGFGGTQRLLRRVGVAMARELVYTGKMIDAAEALRIGLVNSVHEPDALMGAARASAEMICANGPWSIELAKKVILKGRDKGLSDANRLEAIAFGRCFESPQQKEGMQAFLEKRPAKFD